jgi:surface protein
MFNGCKLLNEINLANINTQNVIDMGCFFYGCESLKNLDVSKLNTEV